MPLVSLPAALASRRKFVVNAAYLAGSFLLEPLVGVDARERHLRRAGQVQVVPFQVVEVGLLGGQEPGAVHGALAHQHRRQHGHEPLAARRSSTKRYMAISVVATSPNRRRTGTRTAARRGPCRSSPPGHQGRSRPGPGTGTRAATPGAQHDRVLLGQAVRGRGIGQVGDPGQQLLPARSAWARSVSAASSSLRSCCSSANSPGWACRPGRSLLRGPQVSARLVSSRQVWSAASRASKSSAAPRRESADR